jgi:hypothetical protein
MHRKCVAESLLANGPLDRVGVRTLDGHVGRVIAEREVEFVVLITGYKKTLVVPFVVVVIADENSRFGYVSALPFSN